MGIKNTITIVGISTVIIYAIIQIFNLYGIDFNSYGFYLFFYIFIILSIIILPNNYPSV